RAQGARRDAGRRADARGARADGDGGQDDAQAGAARQYDRGGGGAARRGAARREGARGAARRRRRERAARGGRGARRLADRRQAARGGAREGLGADGGGGGGGGVVPRRTGGHAVEAGRCRAARRQAAAAGARAAARAGARREPVARRSARSRRLPARRQEGRRSKGARRAGAQAARFAPAPRALARRTLMTLEPVTVMVRGRAHTVPVAELRAELDAEGPPRSLASLEAILRCGDREAAVARLRRIVRRGDPGVGTLQAIFGLVRLHARDASEDLEALAVRLGGSPGAIATAAAALVGDRVERLAADVADDATLAHASPQPYLHESRVPDGAPALFAAW